LLPDQDKFLRIRVEARVDQRGGGVISVETKEGAVFDAIVFGEREPRKWSAGSSFFNRTRDLAAPLESAGSNELLREIELHIQFLSDHLRQQSAFDQRTADRFNPVLVKHPRQARRMRPQATRTYVCRRDFQP